jgi:hypothetical protein
MLILLPSATSELLQSASRQASIGEQQPLRTGDAHRGRTCLSLTHVCCEDPKRIKVGTSAKLPQPASYKVRPRLGKAPMTIPVGPTCAPPSPKSAILRILGVEPSYFSLLFRRQMYCSSGTPGSWFEAYWPCPKAGSSAAPFPLGRKISLLLPDIRFLVLAFQQYNVIFEA